MKPMIVAKSAPIEQNILVKEDIGCDGIEIQLLEDFIVNRNVDEYTEILSKHNIIAIHAPLTDIDSGSDSTVNIEELIADSVYISNNVCFIAENVGRKLGHIVSVIFHCEHTYEQLLTLGLYDEIANYIYHMLKICPNIQILIENVTPISYIGEGKVTLTNNFLFDNIELVKHLDESASDDIRDRIGTVFDVCHTQMGMEFLNILKSHFANEITVPTYNIEDYYIKNRKYCKLIHLARKDGHGLTEKTHGQPFNNDDMDIIKIQLDNYAKYNYDCPIVLEVRECNYLECNGYLTSKRLIDKYYNNYGGDKNE